MRDSAGTADASRAVPHIAPLMRAMK